MFVFSLVLFLQTAPSAENEAYEKDNTEKLYNRDHNVLLRSSCLHKSTYVAAAQRCVMKLVLLHILFFLHV